ncbi:hypothetical protein BDV95DRAFT_588837 [Massariosphaeria phaeospora]|uniref:Uncharacterized protein n=1 Tax=Massariosphaeria phaeospora TaxID=100035 RepID=A0A7C8II81_9PLEO|nr:hypothetical protein BDV95DRAFT_588837 [Massariosphaeria phaeospora]
MLARGHEVIARRTAINARRNRTPITREHGTNGADTTGQGDALPTRSTAWLQSLSCSTGVGMQEQVTSGQAKSSAQTTVRTQTDAPAWVETELRSKYAQRGTSRRREAAWANGTCSSVPLPQSVWPSALEGVRPGQCCVRSTATRVLHSRKAAPVGGGTILGAREQHREPPEASDRATTAPASASARASASADSRALVAGRSAPTTGQSLRSSRLPWPCRMSEPGAGSGVAPRRPGNDLTVARRPSACKPCAGGTVPVLAGMSDAGEVVPWQNAQPALRIAGIMALLWLCHAGAGTGGRADGAADIASLRQRDSKRSSN